MLVNRLMRLLVAIVLSVRRALAVRVWPIVYGIRRVNSLVTLISILCRKLLVKNPLNCWMLAFRLIVSLFRFDVRVMIMRRVPIFPKLILIVSVFLLLRNLRAGRFRINHLVSGLRVRCGKNRVILCRCRLMCRFTFMSVVRRMAIRN